MGWFGKKKEEKKKFDYSEETKELFAERDAYYAEQRRKLGGGDSNPELAKHKQEKTPSSRKEDLEDLLGGVGDFNPYVDKDESTPESASIPSKESTSDSSSGYVCTTCGKEFQEKWGKCPSCGGEMKKLGGSVSESSPSAPVETSSLSESTGSNPGDPLDDLLGDFSSSPEKSDDEDSSDELPNSVRMVGGDDYSGLSTDFGAQRSSHSNRKRVRKVKKIKRPRNP